MKVLEEAKKQYWYEHNFDKSQNHWDAHVELSIFAEGWKQALEWVLTRRVFDEEYAKRYNDYTPGIISEKAIKEELMGGRK